MKKAYKDRSRDATMPKKMLKMPNTTKDLGLKIIHWEYAKLEMRITNVELFMKIFCVVQTETNIKNGLLYRSIARLYNNDLLWVNCLAENIFINTEISSFIFSKMKNLMQQAFDKLSAAFSFKNERRGATGNFFKLFYNDGRCTYSN